MLGNFFALRRTAKAVKELTELGMFREIRIRQGINGLESLLFVQHHGVTSIMSERAALGLAESVKRIEAARG